MLSLRSQCLDGIQARCLSRRVIAEEHANGCGEQKRDGDRIRRDKGGPLKRIGDCSRANRSDLNSYRSTDQTQTDCLDKELPQDIAMNSNIAAQRGTPVTLSIEAAQASGSLQSISSIQV